MLVLEQETHIDIIMIFLICRLPLCPTGGMVTFGKVKSEFHNPTFPTLNLLSLEYLEIQL